MPKTLVSIPQITHAAININSNNALLQDISALDALNPKEKLALAVYFRALELYYDATSPVTSYDPRTEAGRINLVQDSQTVLGNVAVRDLMTASLAIDWQNVNNALTVAGQATLSTDADKLRALVLSLAERPEDELRRIALYMRLEIGE